MEENTEIVETNNEKTDTETEVLVENVNDENVDKEKETEEVKDDKKDDKINLDDFEPESRNVDTKKDDEKDDEDIDPEEKQKIDKRIDKRLNPFEEKLQKQNDEIEVNSYLQENPEFSKYKPALLKYIAHPAYKNIPVANIAAIVSAKDMQKIGAAKERAASKKVTESKVPGKGSGRPAVGAAKDYSKLSNAEMEAEIAKAKGQGR